jgi:hypothetical protein
VRASDDLAASVHPVAHSDGTAAAFRVRLDEGALLIACGIDRFTAGRPARILAPSGPAEERSAVAGS